jgi:ParB family transcriptional regulator, chromosome partitioning protein
MTKKRALGRGLSALLENAGKFDSPVEVQPHEVPTVGRLAGGQIAMLRISQIEANPFQPRTKFDEEGLKELAKSIEVHGIIQPITVRKVSAAKFQLISGERRFRASQLAGLEEVPAYIREADDQAMLEMAIVENVQRENLDAIEIAISYKRLLEECSLTQEELSNKVGKDRSTVTNYLRLLKLPAEIQIGIIEKKISMGHARALINAGTESRQLAIYQRILKEDLSVRKVEELVKETAGDKSKGKKKDILSFAQQQMQRDLNGRFGYGARLRCKDDGSGSIELRFGSEDELRHIIELLDL